MPREIVGAIDHRPHNLSDMNKYLIFILLIGSLLASGCSAQGSPTVTVASIPPTRAFIQTGQGTSAATGLFDASRAFEHNRKLSVDIGKRVAGTQGGQNAADYIASEFEKSGLHVTRQPFPFEGWEDRGTTVQLVSPETTLLEAQPLQYSVGGKVDGEVVLIPGLGSRDDFSKVNVRGKIALVKRGTLTFGSKAQNAQEVGALAVLIYNEAPSIFSGTLRERVSIPTLGLSGKSGEAILKLLKSGAVRVKVQSDSGVEKRMGYNIIGTIEGKSDETIVMGGHYDSVSAGPGAGDNGSGTATLLELARVMASQPQPEHTLVFIAFDAEELGLLGSRAYVNELSDVQVSKIQAMLNFDMLGAGGGPLILMGDGNAALLARSSAQQMNIDAHNAQMPANAGSDHESFARRGIDTVFFMRDYNLLHTPEDTIDQVKVEYLGEAGRVGERVIKRLDASPLKSGSSQMMPTQ